MKERIRIVTNGLVKENPSLRLVLGTCPTLAVTTVAMNGLGMGLAATFVLICSNIVISALRKVIPDKVRLPAFITVIATFVTVLQMLVKAYLPSLDTALGIYLPLIVVNCIILGRAEMFASKHTVLDSALDGDVYKRQPQAPRQCPAPCGARLRTRPRRRKQSTRARRAAPPYRRSA